MNVFQNEDDLLAIEHALDGIETGEFREGVLDQIKALPTPNSVGFAYDQDRKILPLHYQKLLHATSYVHHIWFIL